MDERFEDLKTRLAQVSDLGRTLRLLGWDQETMMPRGGAQARAEQLATVSRIAHERFTENGIGGLLEQVGSFEDGSIPSRTRQV